MVSTHHFHSALQSENTFKHTIIKQFWVQVTYGPGESFSNSGIVCSIWRYINVLLSWIHSTFEKAVFADRLFSAIFVENIVLTLQQSVLCCSCVLFLHPNVSFPPWRRQVGERLLYFPSALNKTCHYDTEAATQRKQRNMISFHGRTAMFWDTWNVLSISKLQKYFSAAKMQHFESLNVSLLISWHLKGLCCVGVHENVMKV